MKKFVALALSLTMAMSFAACGGNSTSGETQAPAGSSEASTDAAANTDAASTDGAADTDAKADTDAAAESTADAGSAEGGKLIMATEARLCAL